MTDPTPQDFIAFVKAMRDAGEMGPLEMGAFKVGAATPQGPPITEAQRHIARAEARKQAEELLYASSEGFPITEEGDAP